ncbi:NXPE family member 4-like [Engystomops pustulosus]|uniref:NXPE family member 4-like n=1 Tax=Engystomops pustulosus TaxID=76066 RepID=UPI003AFA46F2
MSFLLSYKGSLISLAAICLLISFKYYGNLKKCSDQEMRIVLINGTTSGKTSEKFKKQINEIFHHIDQKMPKVTFDHKDNTTSAKKSRVFIKNPSNRYCVGDQLTVQVDAYDYLGKRKTYGGDYLRARIYSPDKGAGSSGRIEDFNNGSYRINFTLFWEGNISVSVYLMHPSEAVAALWRSRNSWYGNVEYLGKFTSEDKEVETKCGFNVDQSEELCEYSNHEDDEYFYCVKPQNFSCHSFTEFKNWKTLKTQLSDLENSLLNRSNVRMEIPVHFQALDVVFCNASGSEKKESCTTGMGLEYPSGYVMNETWYPKGCTMRTYHSMEELNKCMKGKFFYMFGDSTMHQWMAYFENKLKTLKLLNVYEGGWAQKHIAVDIERNIHVIWKRHGRPFVNLQFISLREERSIPREIDLIGGNQYTVIALNIGVHFRLFPVHHYIERLLNVRRALERLFLRSPKTKVIIKTENTSDMSNEYEGMSDFHAYVHYAIMEIIFRGLNVGFVNGWDMTTAFNTNRIHPLEPYIRNEINMLMTYICT